ncbi:MAG: aldehyde dehydrogenase family protein, partial [Planctomycetales bacterium]|nr:aldehyde dehydrogenase family protein [Planctomycetales bacterium]
MSTTLEQQQLFPQVSKFLSSGTHKAFVDGKEVASSNGETFQTFDPGSGELLAEICDLQAGDVDQAVAAGARAFRETNWAKLPANERGALLHRLADEIEKRIEIFAQIEALDAGKIYGQAVGDVQNLVDTLRYFTDLAQHVQHRTTLAVKGHEA